MWKNRCGRTATATNVLVEEDIMRKDIFARQGVNMPPNMVFLIANKHSLLHMRLTFGTEFFRDENKALAPPYLKMGDQA